MLSPEAFCDSTSLALQQALPAALAAQTTKYAAADAAANRVIALAAPRPEDYYIGGAPFAARYPAIEIAVPDLAFTNLSLQNFDGDAHPKLLIRVMFQEVKSVELLYRTGCRWFAAVTDCVATPGILGPVDIDEAQGLSGSWRHNPETGTVDEVQSGVLCTYHLRGPLQTFTD